MFIEIPASKKSISSRRLVLGVGVNDADYETQSKVNGRKYICPFYAKWFGMINRCYNEKELIKRPGYRLCYVCTEWLTFSNFKDWMINHDFKGMHLDKDIINPGNKVYSPDNCCFVSGPLNALLTSSAAARGKHPQGVNWNVDSKKYLARVNYNNKRIHLGYHPTPEQASKAYIKAKTKIILQAASEQTDPRIANGLRLHAELLNKH